MINYSYIVTTCNIAFLGMKVKGYWFKVRAKQILAEMSPGVTFSFCNGWFDRFKVRHKISLRRSTNVAQKKADTNRKANQGFHRGIRQVSRITV